MALRQCRASGIPPFLGGKVIKHEKVKCKACGVTLIESEIDERLCHICLLLDESERLSIHNDD